MSLAAWPRLAPVVLLAFLPLSILWKGGKTLETTWLLVAVAWFCTLAEWSRRKEEADAPAQVPLHLWVPLMLFLLWTFLGYFLSATGNYGLDEILRDSSFALLFLWVYRESSRDVYGLPLALRVIQILVITTIVAAFLGIFVYVFQPVTRFVGSFFDPRFHTDYWPNAWAELVLMVWPVVWLWPFRERWPSLPAGRLVGSPALPSALKARALNGSLSNGLARWLVLGLVLATLFLSYSRAAYIAFGVQLLLLGFFHWKREQCHSELVEERHCVSMVRRAHHDTLLFTSRTASFSRMLTLPWVRGRSVVHLFALLCITAGTVLSLNALRAQFAPVQSVAEKLTFAAAEGTSSVTERQQFWKQAWTLARERPLFGWGPYSFRFVQSRLQEGVFATSDHAHNIFLKYAAERGLPAALLLAIFLLTILASVFRFQPINTSGVILSPSKDDIVHSPPHGSWFDELTMTHCSEPHRIIPVIAVSLVGVLIHLLLDFNLHFVGVALPFWLLLAVLAGVSGPSPDHRLVRLAEVSLATALMLLAIFEGRFLLISSLGRRAEARGDFPVALQWYDRSRGEMFSRDLHLSRAHLSLSEKKPDDALRALDDYFRVNRQDARAWKLLGDVQEAADDLPAALSAYEEALRLGKWNHLGALRGLLTVLRAQGEKEIIAERREEFDILLAAYLTAIERNMHFIALTPNVEDFLAVTNALAELFPEDAPQYQAMGARADRHARKERERIAARPVGRLW